MNQRRFLISLVYALSATMAAAAPLSIFPQTLPGGVVDAVYSQALTAAGGSGPPYAWVVSSGSLPPGLALNPVTGVITGSPTVAGSSYSFVVEAIDPAGTIKTQSFSITIFASLTPTTLMLASSVNPARYGEAVTLIASVAPAAATGRVTFYGGVQVLGIVPVSNGQAVLTTILLEAGSHWLHAYLSAPPPYAPSASAPLQQTVNAAPANAFRAAVIGTSPIAAGSLVAAADFNGDGKADIVTTTGVGLGNGDGTFRALIPTIATAVATGDFNGDAKTDLATGAGILLGNGDGTFPALIAYPPGTGAVQAVADFNGDGIADLATDTGVLLGDGDGTFQREKSYWTTSPGIPIVVGDFNGDGKADVFLVAIFSRIPNVPTPIVLLGNGDGSFQAPSLPAIFGATIDLPVSFAAADFNGDGKDDIVESTPASIIVLLSQGDGTFGGGGGVGYSSNTVYSSASSVAIGDFNGDGKLDIAIPIPGNPGVEVFAGNGDGTMQPGVLWALSNTAGSPGAVVAADVNGDGRTDMVAGLGAQTDVLGLWLGSDVPAPPQITTNALPPASAGVPYSASLSASGGTPPYNNWVLAKSPFAIGAGVWFPAGLTLNAATGIISGTPAAGSVGSYFYVSVQDSAGNLAPEQSLTLSAAPPITISAQVLPAGVVGIGWPSQTLMAMGGNGAPYAWAVSSGSLPPGLTLNPATGTISGTPAMAAGSPFLFGVTATDIVGRVSAPQNFSIAIIATSIVTVFSQTLPGGVVGTAYSQTLTAVGGSPPYVWAVSSGSLPPGITINSATGVIAGIPRTNVGSPFRFGIIATDAIGGGSAAQAFSIAISATSPPLQFASISTCRILDTRNPDGPLGGPFLTGNTRRTIAIPSSACGVPVDAAAYSLNLTVAPRSGSLNYLSVWPTGQPQPFVSTLNSMDGSVIANGAVVPAGIGGAIDVYASDDTELIADINGYFTPPASNTLQFYPLSPCRVVDTRDPASAFGGPSLAGGSSRSFPILNSICGAPAGAAAYSLNVTVVPHGSLGFLTAWPTGQTQPIVSTLNSYDGTILANAAIVTAGSGGAVSFFASDPTDLVVDINGYFAPPQPGGLNFRTIPPCRLVDTRNPVGTFGGPSMGPASIRAFPLAQDSCGLPGAPTAQVYSLNVTAVPKGYLGVLVVSPTQVLLSVPPVSTLNATKGQVVANAAIVKSGPNGTIYVWVENSTDIVIDANGYFGP